jgi:hypothetical protein
MSRRLLGQMLTGVILLLLLLQWHPIMQQRGWWQLGMRQLPQQTLALRERSLRSQQQCALQESDSQVVQRAWMLVQSRQHCWLLVIQQQGAWEVTQQPEQHMLMVNHHLLCHSQEQTPLLGLQGQQQQQRRRRRPSVAAADAEGAHLQ